LDVTMVPNLIFAVADASAESVVQHSSIGLAPYIKWSSNQNEW
jgi:hypothetical protein